MQKARPAVCLTEPVTSHRHIVLAFVTSRQPDPPLDTDIGLDRRIRTSPRPGTTSGWTLAGQFGKPYSKHRSMLEEPPWPKRP